MIVLVDYSNLPQFLRERGLQHIVQRILDTLGVARLQASHHAHASHHTKIRLYGGWYDQSSISRDGQALIPVIQGTFPSVIRLLGGNGSMATIASVELATSLLIDPRIVLENTFRLKGAPRRLLCAPPPFLGCVNPSRCVLLPTHSFIKNNTCPEANCNVCISDIIKRAEQKLADTMLTADVIHLASQGETPIAVVSSDVDMWPGIRSALVYGATIFHVQTIANNVIPPSYRQAVGSEYHQVQLHLK